MDLPQSREPEQVGFDPGRLERAYRLLRGWTDAGRLPAAAICVGRRGGTVPPKVFGHLNSKPGAKAAGPDTLFLIASISKPVTVTAVMMLVERGDVALDDPVSRVVPDFARNGKGDVRLRHLMTHTSGLPDMLPNNRALREAHAPLQRFIEETNRLPLLFPPGTRVSYQSMGIALLAEVVHQVTGVTLSEFLRREVFEPLGMADTSLGWDPAKKERIARVRLEPEQQGTDWNWNTPYWLGFGAPWGGLITSPGDFARFCRMLLHGGTLDGVRLLAPSTVRAMTSNQLAAMPLVPEAERRCCPWGLGWRMNWPGNVGSFGDLLGPRTYGHWGATGTLCWLDPDTDAFMVLFTTKPGGDENRELVLVSNAVASALI